MYWCEREKGLFPAAGRHRSLRLLMMLCCAGAEIPAFAGAHLSTGKAHSFRRRQTWHAYVHDIIGFSLHPRPGIFDYFQAMKPRSSKRRHDRRARRYHTWSSRKHKIVHIRMMLNRQRPAVAPHDAAKQTSKCVLLWSPSENDHSAASL